MNSSSFYALLVLAITLCSCVLADQIQFKDCGSNKAVKINKFDVKGCTKFPCMFAKNQNASMTMEFTTTQEFQKVSNSLYGIIAGIKVPFPTSQDACSSGTMSCPVKSSQIYSQQIVIPVLSVYPSISLFVQYQLNDQENNMVICAQFPARLQ